MDVSKKGFLDDTTLSKTPGSPLKSSTVAKENNKRKSDALRKRQQALEAAESSHCAYEGTPTSALSEVTNVPIRRKPDFNLSDASLASEANSSLGILSVGNVSGFTDTSLRNSDMLMKKQASKVQDLRKMVVNQEENKVISASCVAANSLECPAVSDSTENVCSTSNEFSIDNDAANVPEPELNVSYRTQNTSSISKAQTSQNSDEYSSSLTAEKYNCSKTNLTTDMERSKTSRESIFDKIHSSFESLYERLKPEKANDERSPETIKQTETGEVLKVCPFLGFSSFEVDRILQSPVGKNCSYDIENMRFRESTSIDFCPDQISARSSSFASSQVTASSYNSETSGFSSRGKSSVFSTQNQTDLHSQKNFQDESLRDLSSEPKSITVEEFNGENSSNINVTTEADAELNGQANSFNSSYEVKMSNELAFCHELQKELPDFALGESLCSKLGISDSEFLSPDAAKEMLQKDMEIFEQEKKFEIGNLSKVSGSINWSPPSQNNITAPWADDRYSGRQISIGTFISAYTEPLGELTENPNRERPYFGTDASTPGRSAPADSSNLSENFKTSIQGHNGLDDASATLEDNTVDFKTPDEKTSISSAISRFLDEMSMSDPIKTADMLLEKCLSKNKGAKNDKLKKFASSKDSVASQVLASKQKTETFLPVGEKCGDSSNKYKSCESLNKFQAINGIEEEYKTASTPVETTRCLSLGNVSNLSSNDDLNSSRKLPKQQHCGSSHLPAAPSVGQQSFCSSSCSSNPITVNPQHGCMKCYSVYDHCPRNALPSVSCMPQPVNCTSGCQHHCNIPQANAMQAHSVQTLFQTFAGSFPFFQSGNPSSFLIHGPSELHFPDKICIGDSHSLTLTLQNPPVACVYHLSCFSIKVNDTYLQNSPDMEKAGINFSKLIPSSSGNTTSIQLILAPKCEGNIEIGLLVVASFGGNDQGMSAPSIPFRTKVHYEALRPTIAFSSRGKEALDFGSVSTGSTVVEYITLINKSDVAVPLKISLSKDVNDNLLYFGLKEMDRRKYPVSAGLKFPSPKIMEYRLAAANSSAAFSQLEIPVVFQAGNSPNEMSSYIVAGIETSRFNDTLAIFRISASVGISKLILKDPRQNPLIIRAKEGSTVSQNLVVFHEGSLPVVYDLHIEDNEAFQVNPSSLQLKPFEKATITVSFSPVSRTETKCTLQAAAQPYGKVFCITEVIGMTLTNCFTPQRGSQTSLSRSNKLLTVPLAVPKVTLNLIECNKKYLAWGGVDVGNSVIKSFVIRNASNDALQAKLFVKENSHSFQLLDNSDHKASCMTIGMDPGEEKSIDISFKPVQIANFSGLLAVKPIIRNEKKVFSIPLSGYGGISKLKVLGLPDRKGVGYYLDVGVPHQGKNVMEQFIVQNMGSRAAFVKIFLTGDGFTPHSSQDAISVHPSEFVLLENEQKDILVSFNSKKESFTGDYGVISITYGDEIMRQRLRRVIKDAKSKETLGDSVQGVNFDMFYEGEAQVPCDLNYTSSSKDVRLFHSSLRKVMIHLFINGQNVSFSRVSFDALSVMQDSYTDLSFNSTRHSRSSSIRGHSPPVKDKSEAKTSRLSIAQAPSEELSTSCKSQVEVKENVNNLWSLVPETISFNDKRRDCLVTVFNHSDYDMQVYAECTLDFISISPVKKILRPRSSIALEVAVTDQSFDTLTEDKLGFINVISSGQKKRVAIEIFKKPVSAIEYQATADVSLSSEYLGDSSYVESPTPILVENIFNFPKHISLLRTSPGILSETHLTVQNPNKEVIKWDIHPTTVIFSQLDDSVADASKIIRIPTSSGYLKPMQSARIVIQFSPPSEGTYSQFFEICCFCENNSVRKCNIKIEGEAILCATGASDEKENAEISRNENTESVKRCSTIVIDSEKCEFPPTQSGQSSTLYIAVKNFSAEDMKLDILKPSLPFKINHSSVTIKSRKLLKIPLHFKPKTSGSLYEDKVLMTSASGQEFKIKLKGCSL